jgi:hypothetical protein
MPNVFLTSAALVAAVGPAAQPMPSPAVLRTASPAPGVVAHTSFYRILPRPVVTLLPHNVMRLVGTANGVDQTVLLHLTAPTRADDLNFVQNAKLLKVVSSGRRVRLEYSDGGKIYSRTYAVLDKQITVKVMKRSAP